MEHLRDIGWVVFGLLLAILLVGTTVDVIQGVAAGGEWTLLLPLLAGLLLGAWALRAVWCQTSWGRPDPVE